MMSKDLRFIRNDNVVHEVQRNKKGEPTGLVLTKNFPSISKAKQFCRPHPMGVVRRYSSLERECGRQFMKELFK